MFLWRATTFMWSATAFIWSASKGYRFRPWRSPYLRWRMETYWGIQASQIGFSDFWRFIRQHRRELARFLAWAARMR
jgi:hypothetical protein